MILDVIEVILVNKTKYKANKNFRLDMILDVI